MKQTQKTDITKQKILQGAIEEFGLHGFDKGSINQICSDNQISKGLVYHNFKNKDQLYLQAVDSCLGGLLDYLKENEKTNNTKMDGKAQLAHTLALRQEYFDQNEHCAQIIFQSLLQPPNHLKEKITLLRHDLDQYFTQQFRKLLNQVTLRDEISADMAMGIFDLFQNSYHSYFRQQSRENQSFDQLVQNHETQLVTILNVIFYGIAIS